VKFLWQRADARHFTTCVNNDTRRELYASLISQVQFFHYEEMWPTHSIPCPKLPRVNSLELYGTSLRVSGSKMFKPFLGNTLRELKIWTEGDGMEPPTRVQTESDWLSHIGTTCTNLKLEFTMDVFSAELAAFFGAMPQLESLRVGHEMNVVLGRNTVSTILTLPALKELSIDYESNSPFLTGFMANVSSNLILPQLSKLEIHFRDTESLALGVLIANITTLEELFITLQTTAPEHHTVLNSVFLADVSTLPKLRSLDLRLSPEIHLSCLGLTTITSRQNITHFTISSCEDGTPNGMAQMHFTGEDLVYAPITLRLLEVMESIEVLSPVDATYDEAIIISHLINDLSPLHIAMINLNVDEMSSFAWPSPEQYRVVEKQGMMKDLIWKASAKSFATDPVAWDWRNLNEFVDTHGQPIPLDQVATEGSYNHLVQR
jgi:hypothetical protein